jgi:hypothetical protein
VTTGEPPRQPGSAVLFVVVGIVALLLVSLVVGGAALFLRRPGTGRVSVSSAGVLPLPPPPRLTPGLAPSAVPLPTIEAVLDAGTPAPKDAGPAPKSAVASQGAATVSGSLPPDVIQRVVRRHMAQIRYCYEQGLASNPSLAGSVKIHFVIAADGTVATATESDSTLGAPTVTSCITRTFRAMVFPAPSGGIVTATYPLTFTSAGP